MKIKVLQGVVSDGKHLYSFSAQSLPSPPLFRTPSQTQEHYHDCPCERKPPKRGSSANDIKIKESYIRTRVARVVPESVSPYFRVRFRPVSQSNIPSLSATLHT